MPFNHPLEQEAVVVHDGVTKDEPETQPDVDLQFHINMELFNLLKEAMGRAGQVGQSENARFAILGDRIKALR